MKRILKLTLLISCLLQVIWANQILAETISLGSLPAGTTSVYPGSAAHRTPSWFFYDTDYLLMEFTVTQSNTEVNLWTNSSYYYPDSWFDGALCLYDGTGPSAVLMAYNDDLAGGGYSAPLAYDDSQFRKISYPYWFIDGNSWIQVTLGPGTYTAAFTEYSNEPDGNGIGSSTLGDGFYLTNLDYPERLVEDLYHRGGDFTVNITLVSHHAPIPSSALLLGSGLLGLLYLRRKFY